MATGKDALVDRLWRGEATMEQWTASVAGGVGHEIDPDVLVVSTGYLYGNVTAISTGDGLVLIDTGSRETAAETLAAIRRWDGGPVHTIVYSHGHIDHSWGARLIDREAEAAGRARPRIVAHRNVPYRFRRYDATQKLNSAIMGRQFGRPDYAFPGEHRRPDEVYDETHSLRVGGVRIELAHGRGETDDATYVWLPEKRILVSGDFVIWAFPNAGNPRKVQRYAPDWAEALRRMRRLEPEILVPGHGPVVAGAARAAAMLDDGAEALESLVDQTLALMNEGRSLDEVLHAVRPPAALLAKPYLLPKYDDPDFVVRGIWHLYAGWFGGNPAQLKPAPDAALAGEIARLAGGADALAARAGTLAAEGSLRLAAHLIEFATLAAPENAALQERRAEIYARCADQETSLIAKAIFAAATRERGAR